MDEKKERFLKAAPKLTEAEKDKLTGLFQAFLFRRSKTREVWTTCCRQHRIIVPGNSEEEDRLLYEPHTPEPIERQYWREPVNKWEASRRVRCPWCGAEAKLKELGRCGNRKNLSSYQRAVVLRQYRGKLWAMAYDLGKEYTDTDRLGTQKLTQMPDIHLIGLYRFEVGKAESMKSYWWSPSSWGSIDTVTQPGKKRGWMLSSPFGFSKDFGMSYEVVGMEELEKSEFRYCRIPQLQKCCDLLRLLTLCCFYSRQVEFLAKLDLDEVVSNYTERGVKSTGAVKWDASDHKDFLGVSAREVKELVACGGGAEALATYRKLKGTKEEATIRESIEFETTFSYKSKRTIRAKMKAYGLTISKLMRYLKEQAEKENGEKEKIGRRLYTVGEEYKDYLVAAEHIGLDLHNQVFLLPKDLNKKHDEATAAYSRILAEKRSAEEEKAYAPRREQLRERYEFTYQGMCIVVPSCSNAIVQEGKRLRHCVGGYADRHIKGQTTILFLRRQSTPNTPLVTIEMTGNRIIQIHGWDDERTPCKDNPKRESPKVLYQDFLTVWTAWLEAGSRRDKDGQPKLPRKFMEVKSA